MIKNNGLSIGKLSMVDTSNNSREMDDKNFSIHNGFSNIGPTRRTWLWRLKVKVKNMFPPQ